jgi:transposase-like protein
MARLGTGGPRTPVGRGCPPTPVRNRGPEPSCADWRVAVAEARKTATAFSRRPRTTPAAVRISGSMSTRATTSPAPTAEQQRIKDLEREMRDLKEEILKAASIFFARELDPRHR